MVFSTSTRLCSPFEEAAILTVNGGDQPYVDVAASIQTVTEEVSLKMAQALHRQTGLRKLRMAGGPALNSVANGRILWETPFEELYVQPSAEDGGGAVGAALYAYHALLGKPCNCGSEGGQARPIRNASGVHWCDTAG